MKKEKNITPEEITEFSMRMFPLCKKCKHKDVCKYEQERNGKILECKDFLSAADYKTYNNIYTLFQPIFDWLKCHYPHGDIKFVVDNTSAKMYLEHGVFVLSEELKQGFYMPKKENPQIESKAEETVADTQEV